MVASADFTVNGLSVPPEIAVSGGTLVTLALLSKTGCDTIEWDIIGNHSPGATNPAITPAGTPLGESATFPMPVGTGQAYLVRCVINGGVDSEGVAQSSYVKTALVGVDASDGELPFAFGEQFERNATHGTTQKFNSLGSTPGAGDGDMLGPAGAVAGNLASLDATGKIASDSGVPGSNVRRERRAIQAYTGASNDLALTDAAKFATTSHGSACALRVRLQSAIAWLAETEHAGVNVGAGVLTLTGEGGATISGPVTVPQHCWWSLKRTGTNTWQSTVSGDHGAQQGLADDDHPQYLRTDGTRAWTGDQSLDGNKITDAADAADPGDLTPLSQVQTLIASAIAGAAGGGGDGFVFTRSATTADADPGAGTLRLNNATLASVTQLYIDLTDADGNDITAWLDRIDDAFGTAKGYIRVGSRSDRTKWILFKATGLTTTTGYRKIPVTYVGAGTGGAPSTSASDVFFSFESLGFEGTVSAAQGGTGIAGAGGAANRVLRTADGSTWTAAQVALATDVSGTLPFANGGTGLTTASLGQLFHYDGTKLKAFGPTGVSYAADAGVTKALSDGARWLLDDAALTTGRTFTYSTTGATEGKTVSFICTAAGSNHYTLDYGTGTMLISTSRTISLRYSASFGWELAGWE